MGKRRGRLPLKEALNFDFHRTLHFIGLLPKSFQNEALRILLKEEDLNCKPWRYYPYTTSFQPPRSSRKAKTNLNSHVPYFQDTISNRFPLHKVQVPLWSKMEVPANRCFKKPSEAHIIQPNSTQKPEFVRIWKKKNQEREEHHTKRFSSSIGFCSTSPQQS